MGKGYKVVLSHHIVSNVLTSRSLLRTLGDQLRWMKSTRYSRPAGHAGTGLTLRDALRYSGSIAANCARSLTLWVFSVSAALEPNDSISDS